MARHCPRDDEAAMIGGLPIGLRSRRCSVIRSGIPNSAHGDRAGAKDRVGRTLGAFVQRNFLTRDVVEHRCGASKWADDSRSGGEPRERAHISAERGDGDELPRT